MKKLFNVLALALVAVGVNSQTTMKQYTVGHPVTLSIPSYMMRTTGINTSASFQYKSEVKGIYGFVIEDNKEEMKLAEFVYTSINEFFDDFIKDFIEGEEQVKQSKAIVTQKGGVNFLEADLSYFDKEAKMEIYYLIGIVETKTAYYKVMTYCALSDKDKYKEDMRKILYSLKD